MTDQNGKVTSYAYDDADRLTSVTDAASNVTAYGYDTESNLTSITDANSHTTSFAYDAFGRVTQTTFPSGLVETYGYDNVGNLTSKTDRKNQLINYAYDWSNRLTQKSYPDTTAVNYTYDLDSRLTQVTDPTGTYQFTFDNMGRLTATSTSYSFMTARSFATAYTYDKASNRTGFTDPESGSTTYAYDTLNRLSTLTPPSAFTASGNFSYSYNYNSAGRLTAMSSSPNFLSAMHYNAAGQIASETLGTGEVQTYTYDHRNRLTGKSATLNGSTVYSFGLSLAPNGDVLIANDSVNGTWNYAYDAFNRLTCANLSSTFTCGQRGAGTPSYTYVYDRFGNRWQQNGQDSFLATFTGNNPGSPANNNRMDGYSFDAAGNMLSDGTTTYTYDAENRLISATSTQHGTATYLYDANGRRVYRTGFIGNACGSGSIDYLYDLNGNFVVQNSNGGGTACNFEIYAGSRHIASSYNGNLTFDHTDWLGTSRLRYNYTATSTGVHLTQSCTSLPFGDGESCIGNQGSSPLLFTGKERDNESGLDNFDFRYFSSSMGRFMKPDDTEAINSLGNPQGLNLYSYVQNNPTNSVDPDGHDCIYINNDTGKYEGFNSGDCDNSTEEKANTGYYVNGTVNTITTTTGDANGVVTGYNGTSDSGALLAGTFSTSGNNTPSDALNANAVAIFSDINRRNILGNTFKIYGAGALIGATGGAACYYLCPAATVTTLGIATSPLLPIVPSALEKLQRLGLSLQQATEIVESPASQKLVDNLNNGNINVIQDVGGKLVRITLDPSGQRIISAGYVQARNVANSIASGRFTPQ